MMKSLSSFFFCIFAWPTLALAAAINVDWRAGGVPDYSASVGDTIQFSWSGFHDVHRHPSGTCSTPSSTELAASSFGGSYSYSFVESDIGRVTFACQVSNHCNMGQITTVTVSAATPQPTVTPGSPSQAPTVGPISKPPTGCFSGSTKVQVKGKGMVPMQDLQVGEDHVRVATGGYQPIYAWGHYKPNDAAQFLQIQTTGARNRSTFYAAGTNIEMTADHLVHLHGTPKAVPAGALRVGDVLNSARADQLTITRIRRVKRAGLYAPFTQDGTLVVGDGGGVVASTYTTVQKTTAKPEVEVAGIRLPFLAQDQAVHWGLSPLRLWCLFLNKDCRGHKVHPLTGLHPYAHYGLELTQ